MSLPTDQTQAPAGAPGGAAPAPASAAPAFDPSTIKAATFAALDEWEKAKAEKVAKTAADPLAAMKAEVEATRAESEARVKAAVEAARTEERRRAAAIRDLDRAGAHDAEAVLALHPELLKAEDPASALAAIQKQRPFLFASAPQAPQPRIQTQPGSAAPQTGAGSGLSPEVTAAAQRLGIDPRYVAAGRKAILPYS